MWAGCWRKLKQWDLERNTLVIFMTDNGHAVASVYNAGMRGSKGTPYQGGTRVPAFWRWPGVLKPGVDVDKLAAHIDLFPTLAELAGAKIPEGVRLDGRSLVPLLKDPEAPLAGPLRVRHTLAAGPRARRPNRNTPTAPFATAASGWSIIASCTTSSHDPGETTNVIDQHPEVVADMRAAYDQWWSEVLPAMENEDAVGPKINPFKARYWKQFGGGPSEAMLRRMDPSAENTPPAKPAKKPATSS